MIKDDEKRKDDIKALIKKNKYGYAVSSAMSYL
jgi:hypothetical protein